MIAWTVAVIEEDLPAEEEDLPVQEEDHPAEEDLPAGLMEAQTASTPAPIKWTKTR